MANLSRKERRLLEYGTLEQRVALNEKLKALEPPKWVTEHNGLIVLPVITGDAYRESPLQYMIPHAMLDDKYDADGPDVPRDVPASSIAAYRAFIRDWFYLGLEANKFNFKPTVTIVGEQGPLTMHKVMMKYLHFIIDTRDSQHNHKLAYCAYVIDMCCESITWVPFARKGHA